MTNSDVCGRARRSQAIAPRFLVLALASLAAARADAAIGFKSDNGWGVSFEGFVNAFAVNQSAEAPPAGAAPDGLGMPANDQNEFRVRTGLLPGLFAFNVTAPKIDGLDLKARVGIYPQINNGNTRTAFGSQIDLREIFFTVDGAFGQVLAGRALNLYQGKNILNDMTLFGVGVQGAPAIGAGTTLGRIGYGYLYAQFGAQLRYTTPDFSGLKLAVAVVDPSQIKGDVAATVTKAPGVESELSYAAKFGDVAVQGWVSGLYQKAWIPVTLAGKNAAGGAAGLGVNASGLELLASGFVGKGLGSILLLDTDSLDAAGTERKSRGFLAQAAYTFGTTKLGVSYGQNKMDATSVDLQAAASPLETRKSITGGLYHNLTANLKLVAEYTHAISEWAAGQSQKADVIALGGFFLW